MIHGFYIADGKVNYKNRYVQSAKFKKEIEAGRSAKVIVDGFLTLMDGLSMQAVLNPSSSHRRIQRQQLDSFLISLH